MRYAWTAAALLVALVLQSALGILAPSEVRIVDPFMVVVVYCGLTGGETHGMLAGAAAGWIQDIHFGGPIVGLSALTKLVIGFGVGVAGNRFMIVGTPPRSLTLFVAVVVEALLLRQLALVFDIPAGALTIFALLARATITALLGALVFETIDLRLGRSTLRP
jgi:cell shape-determining protein MreD